MDVAEGSQLWGKQFRGQFDEIVRIKEELISFISEKLRSNGTQTSTSTPSRATENAESYKLYLKGKYFFEKRTIDKIKTAIACYEESLRYDPTNLLAYAELAECYRLLHMLDAISYNSAPTNRSPVTSMATAGRTSQYSDPGPQFDSDLLLFRNIRRYLAGRRLRR